MAVEIAITIVFNFPASRGARQLPALPYLRSTRKANFLHSIYRKPPCGPVKKASCSIFDAAKVIRKIEQNKLLLLILSIILSFIFGFRHFAPLAPHRRLHGVAFFFLPFFYLFPPFLNLLNASNLR